MPSILEWASQVAAQAIPQDPVRYGPWLGSMRSVSADRVPREYASGGSNFRYVPSRGTFRRRSGQTQKFDTFGAAAGMLQAKWSGKVRWGEEFLSESISDGTPTVCALLTKETVASGLDDGRFSNFWVRDQVNGADYTVGSEYDGTSYPTPGSAASYKITPLWYDSGDGGITRGTTEFARRFFFSGARRFLKVGNWTYFPSVLGTPSRWRGHFRPSVAVTQQNNRLSPTGPFCPLHSGTVAKGSIISDAGAVTIRPDADVTVGGWTTAPLFSKINETTLDTAAYIQAAGGSAACTVGLGDPAVSPGSSDIVRIRLWYSASTGAAIYNSIVIDLMEGATARASFTLYTNNLVGFVPGLLQLTPTQIASVTDWTAVRLRFTATGIGSQSARIAQAYVEIIQAVVQSQGGWKGSDRFYYSCAFRFEDGSVWATCPPRPPSAALPSGFNLFTVDPDNPLSTYDRVTYSNLPKRPFGCVGLLICRTPKISAVKDDNLQLNPYDLRVITEITDATTTTYDDYYGTDDSLTLDAEKLFIRFDHAMAPRARYIFGGDMRICHSYGGQSPCAIQIAPVGRAADYDLNLSDDDATAYNYDASFMQVSLDTAGAGTMTLLQTNGVAVTDTKAFAFSTYDTLQKLVDAVNATSFATDGQQWRAQLCPGASPDAGTLNLTPHSRAIASCVIAGQTITKAAGGLSKVAVGSLISGAGVTVGAYVSRIDSDTQLTFVGAITAGVRTLTFYTELGDAPTAATANSGYQRVICSALQGFLYFTSSYLAAAPLDKQAVWMTVAPPGSSKSAANCFSLKGDNRFTPPANAGISMGGGGVGQGFVVPFANQVYAIKNVLSFGTGLDRDYRIVALNEARGCCAWNTVGPGNRFVPYLTPEGIVAADLDGELLLSGRIFLHSPATGDFGYEIPLCVAASAADTDAAYASARVMRGGIWVNYRASGSHPNREVLYDFSAGTGSGLQALLRNGTDGPEPWGWSLPLVRSVTAMAAARRTDGSHLYGWNDENAGSTGDGRLDEIETGDTDNGSAITGSVETPWERLGANTLISAQEVTLEHSAPVGSTGFLDFHRSYSDVTYPLTPSTSDTLPVIRDLKMLPTPARAATAACFLGYRQTAGGARELRSVELRIKSLSRSYR